MTKHDRRMLPQIKCWTCGSIMEVFTTEDGNEAGYICASCPDCLARIR
jgi:hypothetical protein